MRRAFVAMSRIPPSPPPQPSLIKSRRASSFAIAWMGARLDASSLAHLFNRREWHPTCLLSLSLFSPSLFFLLSASPTLDTKDTVYLILWLMARTESLKFPICLLQVTFVASSYMLLSSFLFFFSFFPPSPLSLLFSPFFLIALSSVTCVLFYPYLVTGRKWL